MHDFQAINYKRGSDNRLKISNPTSYPLIGKGAQGAVFKLDEKRCVKIYVYPKNAEREYSTYQAISNSSIAPKVYKKGASFIVMEFLKGPSLDIYLKKKGKLSSWITRQLVFIIKEMKRLKFTRIDVALRHVFIAPNKQLKIIDLVKSYTKRIPFPVTLLGDLDSLGLMGSFMMKVKEIEPELFSEWQGFLRYNPI